MKEKLPAIFGMGINGDGHRCYIVGKWKPRRNMVLIHHVKDVEFHCEKHEGELCWHIGLIQIYLGTLPKWKQRKELSFRSRKEGTSLAARKSTEMTQLVLWKHPWVPSKRGIKTVL